MVTAGYCEGERRGVIGKQEGGHWPGGYCQALHDTTFADTRHQTGGLFEKLYQHDRNENLRRH